VTVPPVTSPAPEPPVKRADLARWVQRAPLEFVPSWRGRARINDMEEAPLKVTLREPGVAGRYIITERRADGALVLEPERERLSAIIAETEGRVFRDEEFVEHLERVARAEDDLPADERG
jgi:hypothetical protein